MIYTNVPDTLNKIQEHTDTSLHAMSLKAGVAYATAHAWKTGKASPTIDKFTHFLEANGFKLRVVLKT
jgi:hypothetical protein